VRAPTAGARRRDDDGQQPRAKRFDELSNANIGDFGHSGTILEAFPVCRPRCGAELELAASAQLAHSAATLHMKKSGHYRGDLRRSLMDLRVDVMRKQGV
jgi:hypothetical protein